MELKGWFAEIPSVFSARSALFPALNHETLMNDGTNPHVNPVSSNTCNLNPRKQHSPESSRGEQILHRAFPSGAGGHWPHP